MHTGTTVNWRALRILLECIIVLQILMFMAPLRLDRISLMAVLTHMGYNKPIFLKRIIFLKIVKIYNIEKLNPSAVRL